MRHIFYMIDFKVQTIMRRKDEIIKNGFNRLQLGSACENRLLQISHNLVEFLFFCKLKEFFKIVLT